MKNLSELLKKIDEYTNYLRELGQTFTAEGWPVFKPEQFLTKWPSKIVPYWKRTDKRFANHREVALCLYCPDKNIFPRLDKVLDDIPVYLEYMGVVGCDMSVDSAMDEEYQEAVMLLNRLHMAILANNGAKVIANTRTGGAKTLRSLKTIPKSVMCASGFLGCDYEPDYDMEYVAKILTLRPSKLIIYGKCNESQRAKLDRVGINYRVYPDYRRFSKEMKNHG